ncbi:uncharacterized protein IL334_006373 [Kwoniella shivajii]|uniref:DNA-directed RNA polymerase III subunit RPC4 n=1 Tax=Kwoniella shivajii TaxID=564305 RepID=A0ABZ1D7D4_9TREE|nr:hypothetical protein IL334_006373 [Kwoniella shivajii]
MSNPPPVRGKPSLIAAAQAQPATIQPTSGTSVSVPPNLASVPMSVVSSEGSNSVSARSTPAPSVTRAESSAPPGGVQRMKFKPKVPIRRMKQEVDVKPDITSAPAPSVSARGGLRGRGRGAAGRGRGRGAAPTTSIAAGVFGGPRPVQSASSSRRFAAAPAPAPRIFDEQDAEVYSDHSDHEGTMGRPIDIDLVSTMSESAPTSLYRDRRLNDKKAKENIKKDKGKNKKKDKSNSNSNSISNSMDIDSNTTNDINSAVGYGVKAEPISPEKQSRELERQDDVMLSDDEMQDRDNLGRRVRNFAQTGGMEDPRDQHDMDRDEDSENDDDVNEAQKVDLSESEEEEEEEDMQGDFVQADGMDNPEEKLFIFQFPHLFPKFLPSDPVDLTQPSTSNGDLKPVTSAAAPSASANGSATKDIKPDVKPDIKPNVGQLRGGVKKPIEHQPEGRIGTMVVMKSGKVKIVMGKDIVMNVTPGLPTTFIQHLVHLDQKTKSAQVLGEVHKNYIVTPDVDRLLQELYINGGQTPGEVDADRRRKLARERGLMTMKREI